MSKTDHVLEVMLEANGLYLEIVHMALHNLRDELQKEKPGEHHHIAGHLVLQVLHHAQDENDIALIESLVNIGNAAKQLLDKIDLSGSDNGVRLADFVIEEEKPRKKKK